MTRFLAMLVLVAAATTGVRADSHLVDFSLPDADGQVHRLSDHRGKWVVINFWATWCAPCRIEMPALERLHQELADRGLRVVGVDVGEETDDVKRFVEETGITFEIVIDHDLSTGRVYAARSLPMTYILDPEGTIVARAIGVRDWDSEPMRDMFAALVGGG
jgi:peroxiredoxin